jgi:hypothetical protein
MAFYGQPYVSVSWQDRGVIDYAAARSPGRLVNSITSSFGTVPANAYITSRQWDFTDSGYVTRYATQRVNLDFEAIR